VGAHGPGKTVFHARRTSETGVPEAREQIRRHVGIRLRPEAVPTVRHEAELHLVGQIGPLVAPDLRPRLVVRQEAGHDIRRAHSTQAQATAVGRLVEEEHRLRVHGRLGLRPDELGLVSDVDHQPVVRVAPVHRIADHDARGVVGARGRRVEQTDPPGEDLHLEHDVAPDVLVQEWPAVDAEPPGGERLNREHAGLRRVHVEDRRLRRTALDRLPPQPACLQRRRVVELVGDTGEGVGRGNDRRVRIGRGATIRGDDRRVRVGWGNDRVGAGRNGCVGHGWGNDRSVGGRGSGGVGGRGSGGVGGRGSGGVGIGLRTLGIVRGREPVVGRRDRRVGRRHARIDFRAARVRRRGGACVRVERRPGIGLRSARRGRAPCGQVAAVTAAVPVTGAAGGNQRAQTEQRAGAKHRAGHGLPPFEDARCYRNPRGWRTRHRTV
jgi:hypothetical protein